MDMGILVGYQRSMGLQRVRHDLAHTHTHTLEVLQITHENQQPLLPT